MFAFCKIKTFKQNKFKNKIEKKLKLKHRKSSSYSSQQIVQQSISSASQDKQRHRTLQKNCVTKIKKKDGCKNKSTVIKIKNCEKMTDQNSGNAPGSAKKRGHQHHPKSIGTRRSNVPAGEVIAALKRNDDSSSKLSVTDQNIILQDSNKNDIKTTSTTTIPTMKTLIESNYNNNVVTTKNEIKVLDDNFKEDTSSALCDKNIVEKQQELVQGKKSSSKKKTPSLEVDSSKNKSKIKNAETKKRKIRSSQDMTKQERPAVEGAEGAEIENDENDPEAAEWSKLRCTSERTEVIAEREHRRLNRRCADYPGLAFGRSIFSSDTMMKFNIIRNELHNIMNTQLKRVGLSV